MATKRPSNGPNLTNRRSNLGSKNNKWKEQLVQGNKERDNEETMLRRLDEQQRFKNEQKIKMKMEARQYEIDNGFLDINEVEVQKELPEWKKYKLFIKQVFPTPVICKKYNGDMIFKNKEVMQQYYHREVSVQEWAENVNKLAKLRQEMEEKLENEKSSMKDTSIESNPAVSES